MDYGPNNTFKFSDLDNGFPIYFDLVANGTSYLDAIRKLNDIIDYGYFDNFTRSINFDIGHYSSAT